MLLNLVPKCDFVWIVSCSWSNHIILLLMFVAEKVLLLLVISLTAYGQSSVSLSRSKVTLEDMGYGYCSQTMTLDTMILDYANQGHNSGDAVHLYLFSFDSMTFVVFSCQLISHLSCVIFATSVLFRRYIKSAWTVAFQTKNCSRSD